MADDLSEAVAQHYSARHMVIMARKNGVPFDLENPIQGVVAIALDTPVAAGREFGIICTVPGNVNVTFADGSVYVFPVDVGMTVWSWAVTKVTGAGTTATATYTNFM